MEKQSDKKFDAVGCTLGCTFAVCMVILFFLCMLICTSCKTKYITSTEYKEIPVAYHDTLVQMMYSHDTTIVRDSVLIQQKGDTIFYTKYKDVLKTKFVHDTISKVVEKPVTIYQTNEKITTDVVYRQKWWQKILSCIGAIVSVFGIVWLLTKIKK